MMTFLRFNAHYYFLYDMNIYKIIVIPDQVKSMTIKLVFVASP